MIELIWAGLILLFSLIASGEITGSAVGAACAVAACVWLVRHSD